MNQIDETYELIRTMSPNEKRFFRLSVIQAGKEANYLRVFSAMDAMDEFDQERLRSRLRGKKLNLSYEKNYLYKQLLRSFRHFYTDSSSAIEALDILKSIEIVYRKRLNMQCQKLISKGIGLCTQYELWNYHLELIDWQHRLNARTGNYKALADYHAGGFREKQELIGKISAHLIRQEEMSFILSAVQTKGIFLGAQEKERFAQLMKDFPGDGPQPSFRTTEMMFASQALMHHYAGNLEQAYRWSGAGLELYRKNPQFITDQAFRYFASTANVINRCLNLKKYEEALEHISELKAFIRRLDKFSLQDIGSEYPATLLNWSAKLLFSIGRREEALKAAKEFERSSNLKRLRPQQRLMADSDLARIYFYNGLYKESLRYINRQLREESNKLRPDFLLFAHLLRLCINTEMNDRNLLDSQLGAVRRFIKKHKVNDKFVVQLISMLKELGTAHEEARQLILKKFYPPLARYAKEAEQYDVILDWVKRST